MQAIWRPIETAPTHRPVDVYFINDTLEPPVEGVLHRAELKGDYWEGSSGCIPQRFIVSWAADQNGVLSVTR